MDGGTFSKQHYARIWILCNIKGFWVQHQIPSLSGGDVGADDKQNSWRLAMLCVRNLHVEVNVYVTLWF